MDKYYAYSPETGFETFPTVEAAKEYANDSIESYRECAEEGWDEAVRQVSWGEIRQEATLTTEMTAEEAEEQGIGCACDMYWDFSLEDLKEEPNTEPRTIQVWMEGYHVQGNKGTAQFIGSVEATSMPEAVQKLIDNGTIKDPKYVNYSRTAYWGCRYFDNEADARKSCG